MKKNIFNLLILTVLFVVACQKTPADTPHVEEDVHVEGPATMPSADNPFPDRPALTNESGIEGLQTFPDKSVYHEHVDSVQDPAGAVPPSFGEHFPVWQNCGIYDQPVEVGTALHSMEHGAVWLTYSPKVTAEQIAELQAIVRENSKGFILMSPYATQSAPVVLTAWTVQLTIDTLPDERIEKFIQYYQNGPQNPEPGAPCSGALGEPLP